MVSTIGSVNRLPSFEREHSVHSAPAVRGSVNTPATATTAGTPDLDSHHRAGRAAVGGQQAITTDALGVAVAARVPVLLWGAPGTGKTSAIRAMADAMGWPCETVIAVDPGAVRLRRPPGGATGRAGATSVSSRRRPGPTGWRRRAAGPALPRRDLDRSAGRPGRPAAGRARAGGGRSGPARRGGGGGRGQPARAGGRRLGPVGPSGQPVLPSGLDGRPPGAGRGHDRGLPGAARPRLA